jgi:serpin B
MRKRSAALAAFGVVTILATGCGSGPAPVTPGELVLLRAEVAQMDPPLDAPVPELVAGIAAFGYDLVPVEPTRNWVASPASIAFVMAMVRAGAAGATAAEIDETFGFPARVHEAFNALGRQIVTADAPPSTSDAQPTREPWQPARPSIVCVGNAIFPAQGFPIEEPYLRTLAEQYGTGVYPLDFHQPAAKDAIDAWARQMTAGRIQKVFDQIDSDTAAVLANTVYFKGEWRVPFDDANTRDEPFHRADASTVSASTMADEIPVGYSDGPGWQAIAIPYGEDGAFSMWVLLPTDDLTPRDLLAPSVLSAARDFETQRVDVRLPRWDFAADVALKDELIRLGLGTLFDPNQADLSGISEIDLYVTQAVHRATITVDEYGSEAAAVTAAVAAPTSAPPPPSVSFHADHPFAFAIVHNATATPLFYGVVADPTTE